jgi:hypothetical protein
MVPSSILSFKIALHFLDEQPGRVVVRVGQNFRKGLWLILRPTGRHLTLWPARNASLKFIISPVLIAVGLVAVG